ncbi:MAG: hypothetical protein PSN35_03525 [Candidatus Thioglobus sp.]|uniref:hypothetical protein n=1 Tax=Candidatus Thioglobus sp. TaxID=2026721 RepID=UPI0026224C90|nr:hypothetical protein [Candidatus Thioglobus sp.]MDC9726890.1 hypothetical protein [Candidatus Thioglobus sp.]
MNTENKKKSALVGYGFDENLMRSVKGDESLKDSVYNRERTHNIVDKNIDDLLEVILFLLLSTGVFRIVIGLNNGEIKTSSVFDPFNVEIHLAQDLLEPDYVFHHFGMIALDEKEALIKRYYEMLEHDPAFDYLSDEWQAAFHDRNQIMKQLTDEDELRYIIDHIPALRNLDGYYLRSTVINLFNSTISMSFNCDGTQIMSHKKFREFIEEYV